MGLGNHVWRGFFDLIFASHSRTVLFDRFAEETFTKPARDEDVENDNRGTKAQMIPPVSVESSALFFIKVHNKPFYTLPEKRGI